MNSSQTDPFLAFFGKFSFLSGSGSFFFGLGCVLALLTQNGSLFEICFLLLFAALALFVLNFLVGLTVLFCRSVFGTPKKNAKAERHSLRNAGIGCLGSFLSLLILLLLPGFSQCTSAAQKFQNFQQMRQLADALKEYAQTHDGSLPPAGISHAEEALVPDENGIFPHSWRVWLLPYVGENELFVKIRKNEPWNSSWNQQFHQQMPPIFANPAWDAENPDRLFREGQTTYVLLTGPGTAFPPGVPSRKLPDLLPANARKVLMTETKPACWMDPAHALPASEVLPSPETYSSPETPTEKTASAEVCRRCVVWMDGSVDYLEAEPAKLPAYVLIEDGKTIPETSAGADLKPESAADSSPSAHLEGAR